MPNGEAWLAFCRDVPWRVGHKSCLSLYVDSRAPRPVGRFKRGAILALVNLSAALRDRARINTQAASVHGAIVLDYTRRHARATLCWPKYV